MSKDHTDNSTNFLPSAFKALGIRKDTSVLAEISPERQEALVNPKAREDDLDLSNLPKPSEEYVPGRYRDAVGHRKKSKR